MNTIISRQALYISLQLVCNKVKVDCSHIVRYFSIRTESIWRSDSVSFFKKRPVFLNLPGATMSEKSIVRRGEDAFRPRKPSTIISTRLSCPLPASCSSWCVWRSPPGDWDRKSAIRNESCFQDVTIETRLSRRRCKRLYA